VEAVIPYFIYLWLIVFISAQNFFVLNYLLLPGVTKLEYLPVLRKESSVDLKLDRNFECNLRYQSRPGVGKVRPAGQIRPAEALCPARGVVLLTLFVLYFMLKGCLTCYLSKRVARRVQKKFNKARERKKLPTPVQEPYVLPKPREI